MAKIELRCTDEFKLTLKNHCIAKGTTITKYIKAAVVERIVEDVNRLNKEG